MAIMKNIAVLLLLALSVLCTEETMAQPLPRSTPEEQGISSTAILDFVKTVEGEIDALHSFMLLRHGKVVAEGWWYPYAAERSHRLYSLSTSFVSTAIGIAVADGELSRSTTGSSTTSPTRRLPHRIATSRLCASGICW